MIKLFFLSTSDYHEVWENIHAIKNISESPSKILLQGSTYFYLEILHSLLHYFS